MSPIFPPAVVEYDICVTNPCKNNGTCVKRGTDYICECTRGYRGKDCELGE